MSCENNMSSVNPGFFMGIDVGTYESKGVLVDQDFKIVAQHAVSHGLENPKKNHYEHDALDVWWHDVCRISKELLRISNVDPSRIKAIGTSALGADCLPVDAECNPLRKAILYGIDSRAEKEMDWLTDYWGSEKIKGWYGRPLCSSDVMPKILWIKNNEPDVYAKTHKFLTGSSFLTAKLTGRFTVDRFLGLASFNPLYNRDGSPNPETCQPICRPDQLAEVLNTIHIAGNITRKAALETGLAVGTPVIVGTDDSGAEAISTGVVQPGDMMIQIGSSVYMILCANRLVNDDRIWREEFIIPNTFDVSAGTNAAGTLTKWYRDNLFQNVFENEKLSGVNAFQLMSESIKDIPAGSDGLITLPYFAGERTPINDPNAKGLIFGLKLTHTKQHLYKSALEGVCYSVSQHFKIFSENHIDIKNIMVVGGGTKNPEWMQILSDVTGRTLNTAEITIGASYGDTMLAAMGIGHFKDYSDIQEMIKVSKQYVPNLSNHEKYTYYQSIFDELYVRNKDLMHLL